ncbi:hypothetical protein M405DRAFT_835921 [Rhizopogon salebrosus TDB-379]|nr:hypothetical protein M405DRAFT_835921 [Rhizopogon salebrosus TDB-379]
MCSVSVRKGPVKNTRYSRVINNRTGQLGDVQCIPRIRFESTPPRATVGLSTASTLPHDLQPSTVGRVSHWTELFSTCAAT